MPRRFANQVHRTASNLLREGYLKTPPAWFEPVLQFPPIQLPPRGTPSRSWLFDTPSDAKAKQTALKTNKPPKPKPEEVVYSIRDKVRRQFFRDHPFEAFNPRSLLEGAEIQDLNPIRGEKWVRLKQRGRNPVPEDAVNFAVSLHEYHNIPLAQAYHSSIAQYRALRSELQIASAVAALEAEAYGHEFGPSEIQKSYEKENEALESWTPQTQGAKTYSGKLPWVPIWKMPGTIQPPEEWSRGQEYATRLQEGVRPNYTPDFVPVEQTKAEDAVVGAEEAIETEQDARERRAADRRAYKKEQADLMGLFPKDL